MYTYARDYGDEHEQGVTTPYFWYNILHRVKIYSNESSPWSELRLANQSTRVECWEAQYQALFIFESKKTWSLRRSQLMDHTLTTPNSTVAFCCSELESSTSTFYITVCPTLQRICERYKSAYPLFGRLVRCSAHGCSYAILWYMQKCIRIEE